MWDIWYSKKHIEPALLFFSGDFDVNISTPRFSVRSTSSSDDMIGLGSVEVGDSSFRGMVFYLAPILLALSP